MSDKSRFRLQLTLFWLTLVSALTMFILFLWGTVLALQVHRTPAGCAMFGCYGTQYIPGILYVGMLLGAIGAFGGMITMAVLDD